MDTAYRNIEDTPESSYVKNGAKKASPNGSANKNRGKQVITPVNVSPTSYATKLSLPCATMDNIQKLEANVPNDVDYDVWLPLASVLEVNSEEFALWNLVMAVPNLDGPGYMKETIRVEYYPKAPKRVVNKVDKVMGGSFGVDDEAFIEVKKKKSGGINEGTKQFKPIPVKPKTQYHPKVN
ncbi:hypothetical protein Tco_0808243 [Tanacetum coccineum]